MIQLLKSVLVQLQGQNPHSTIYSKNENLSSISKARMELHKYWIQV